MKNVSRWARLAAAAATLAAVIRWLGTGPPALLAMVAIRMSVVVHREGAVVG